MNWKRTEKGQFNHSRFVRTSIYDEITNEEAEEIWNRETPDQVLEIRLNVKYVRGTAKQVYDFINAHEELIRFTSLGKGRVVMKKVMMVIKEADDVERK